MATEIRSIRATPGNIAFYDITDEVQNTHISVTPAELIEEIYRLRRLTRFGAYASNIVILFLMFFLMDLTVLQVGLLQAIYWSVTVVSVELSFVHGFRLGKHDTYPGAVVTEVGKADHLNDAVRRSLKVVHDLLRVDASFLVLPQDSADQNDANNTSDVFCSGMSHLIGECLLQAGAPAMQTAMQTREPLPFNPDGAALPEKILGAKERLVFVPIVALQESIGVLAVLGKKSNADIRDRKLLYDIGSALGLSLQNFRQKDKLYEQKEELHAMTITDDLTGIYNRRYFFHQLERELAAAQRYERPLSIIMFDLDDFKEINDNFGHTAGDEALCTIAQRLARHARSTDIVARLGGDEFVVILPQTDERDAADVVRRLEQAVSQDPLDLANGASVSLSISGGFCSYPDDAADIDELVRQADAGMYANKAARKSAARR